MQQPGPDLRSSALVNATLVVLLALLLPLMGRPPSLGVDHRLPDTRPWGCRTCAVPMPTPDAPPVVPKSLGEESGP